MMYEPTDMRTGSGDTGRLLTDVGRNLADLFTMGRAERVRWQRERQR